METRSTDVLVIGSGFGAAAPAMRLSEAGADVIMIEKGKDIVPERDFKHTQDPKYYLKYLAGMSSDQIGFTYAEAFGGGSGFYEMVSLRAPSKVFEQTGPGGELLWPGEINRKTLDPFYDVAEEMLHVEQIGVDEVPKSGVVFSNMMKRLGYSCDRARYAVKGCIGSGFCVTGCLFGAKQSLHFNYLPRAKSAGMRALTETEVIEIRTNGPSVSRRREKGTLRSLPHRYAVLCKDLSSGRKLTVKAKIVILGGGTVGTAKVLLASRENLRMLSRHVGKNIAFNGSVKTAGLIPEGRMEGDMFSGRSHPGMISYHFLDSLGITISTAKPLPVDVLSSAHLVLEGSNGKYWGQEHVDLMKHFRHRVMVLYALGLTPPCAEIQQTGNSFEPKLELTAEIRNYYKSTQNLLNSILKRNGCRLVLPRFINGEGKEYGDIHFTTTHMVGSCRMADTKRNGATNCYGEVFDYPGLYVSDGAAIPSSLAVNSSLTILANAERIADHLVKQYCPERKQRTQPIVRHD